MTEVEFGVFLRFFDQKTDDLMDSKKSKENKFPGLKKLLLSLTKSSAMPAYLPKSKSCHTGASTTAMASKDDKRKKKRQVAPDGCFSVYVGPQKQRFVIKTEYANHPLFKMLLDDAELEYGFDSEGPIKLPCDVGLFYKVLAEMDRGKDDEIHSRCGFGYGSCSPFTPPRRSRNGNSGYGSYGLLTPSPLMKMNHF